MHSSGGYTCVTRKATQNLLHPARSARSAITSAPLPQPLLLPLLLIRTPILQIPSTFYTDLAGLLQSNVLCDATFVVGQERIPAHRCILAARSEYFATLLTSDFIESRARCIEVVDATPAGFRALLHYLYTDELLPVEEDVMVDVMQMAQRYHLVRLYHKCLRHCQRGLGPHNAVLWLLRAHVYHLSELRELSLRYCVRHFGSVRSSAKGTLDVLKECPDLMLEILLEIALAPDVQ